MKYDFTQSMLSLNGEPMKNEDDEDLTLGQLCAAALSRPDRDTSANDRLKFGRLARAVYAGTSVELTIKQISCIQEQLLKHPALNFLAADAHDMLEPEDLEDHPPRGKGKKS